MTARGNETTEGTEFPHPSTRTRNAKGKPPPEAEGAIETGLNNRKVSAVEILQVTLPEIATVTVIVSSTMMIVPETTTTNDLHPQRRHRHLHHVTCLQNHRLNERAERHPRYETSPRTITLTN